MPRREELSDRALRRRYRIRVSLFIAAVLLVFAALNVAVRTANTLSELERVEAARDQWQKPEEILGALDVKPGAVVADIGSGSGYFSLKLSRHVGTAGRVIAVDVRRTPLFFVSLRALLGGHRNVQTRRGKAGDPGLSGGPLDGVLILNTYHEFEDPRSVLTHVFHALRPGTRLVIADRSSSTKRLDASSHHAAPLAGVLRELREARFEVVTSSEPFIDWLGDRWWLVVGRKPTQVRSN